MVIQVIAGPIYKTIGYLLWLLASEKPHPMRGNKTRKTHTISLISMLLLLLMKTLATETAPPDSNDGAVGDRINYRTSLATKLWKQCKVIKMSPSPGAEGEILVECLWFD